MQTQDKKTRYLYPGDHFGEIALIYECNRTATVLSNNYSTLATLSTTNFKELTFKYSGILDQFKERIYAYNDNLKLFKEKTISTIPFFHNLDVPLKHEVLFSLK